MWLVDALGQLQGVPAVGSAESGVCAPSGTDRATARKRKSSYMALRRLCGRFARTIRPGRIVRCTLPNSLRQCTCFTLFRRSGNALRETLRRFATIVGPTYTGGNSNTVTTSLLGDRPCSPDGIRLRTICHTGQAGAPETPSRWAVAAPLNEFRVPPKSERMSAKRAYVTIRLVRFS